MKNITISFFKDYTGDIRNLSFLSNDITTFSGYDTPISLLLDNACDSEINNALVLYQPIAELAKRATCYDMENIFDDMSDDTKSAILAELDIEVGWIPYDYDEEANITIMEIEIYISQE